MAEAPIKRLRYFTGQFLEALDFQAEQSYHINMRQRGKRPLYGPGLLDGGLLISAVANDGTKISISPGMAIDAQGHDIVLVSDLQVSLPAATPVAQSYFVTLSYAEIEEDQQTPDADVGDNTRIEEKPSVNFVIKDSDIQPNVAVVIGRVTVGTDGRLSGAPDLSTRRYANARVLGALGIGTAQPTHQLHVLASGGVGLLESTTDTAYLRLANNQGLNNRVELANRAGGRLALYTAAGGDVLNITRDGQVGIGTTAPTSNSKLHIQSGGLVIGQTAGTPARADASLHISGTVGNFGRLTQMIPEAPNASGLNLLGSRGAQGAEQWWAWGVTADQKWRIQSGTDLSSQAGLTIAPTGTVGIGTSAPSNVLHVNGSEGIRQNSLYLSGGPGGSSVSYNAYRSGNGSAWMFPDATRPAVTLEIDDAGGKARFDVWTSTTAAPTSWVNRLRIDGETGNVGINTVSPTSRLHVVGGAQITDNTSIGGTSPGNFRLMVSGGDTRLAAPGQEQGLFGLDRLVGYNDLRFFVDDTGTNEVMHLDNNGLNLRMSNPASNTGFRNTLTPKNIPKAWGIIETGPNPRILDGFNVDSVITTGGQGGWAMINLKESAGSNLAVMGNMHYVGQATISCTYRPGGSQIEVYAYYFEVVGGSYAVSAMRPFPFSTQTYYFSFVVYGAQ